jgi:methylglyoxal synthase
MNLKCLSRLAMIDIPTAIIDSTAKNLIWSDIFQHMVVGNVVVHYMLYGKIDFMQ